MNIQKDSIHRFLKKLGMTAGILIITAAVLSGVMRSLTPWASQYKGQVEEHLSTLIGKPVTIKTLRTGWYWLQPVLKLQQVTINTQSKDALQVEKLFIGIDLFKSLWHWKIEPGVLYVEDTDLVLTEESNKGWNLKGISDPNNDQDLTPQTSHQAIAWLAQQERLILRNVSIHFHFRDGSLIPVNQLNLSIVNHSGYYKLKGDAHLEQINKTAVQFLGDLRFDPYHLESTTGHLYASLSHVIPAQWQNLFPNSLARLEGGKGDIAVWVDFKDGAVSLVQSKLNFKRLAWQLLHEKKSQLIQSLSGNLAWKPTAQGWSLSADHVLLRVGTYKWPENQLSVLYDKRQNSYQLYAKNILLESLFSLAVDFPDSLSPLIDAKVHGSLTDTQISIKDQQLQSLLMRFDQLGWNGKKPIPKVENLSGVLNWQPEEGRLELDSEQTRITADGFPSQNLDLLNTAVDWKTLSNGLRISIDRFVLTKPDLILTAEGAIDDVSKESLGHIRLDAAFSGKHLEQWIALIPKKYLKPKLNLWLKKDIKQITDGTGKLSLNGMAKDFPFDNNNGVFSITGHFKGVDLFITQKWQLITDLEAYLRVKSRNLDVDVVNANLSGVPVHQMNLRIDDIGKDKETLLVFGTVQAAMDKMLDFVMASPLKKKLATLNMLKIKGDAALNLHVEAPLYPENDDVLVKGDLSFKNNEVLVQHRVGSIPLEDVSGDLSFTDQGITQSALVATAFGYPLNISLQSVQKPRPYTTIMVDGECTVESLAKRFNSPIFALIKGMFAFKADFKLTEDPNDFDSLHITTPLKGVAVKLPAPLGKSHQVDVTLDVNLDFNPTKAIRLRANYGNRLSTDLYFDEVKGAFDLQSGQIKLGGGHAINQKKPGVDVVGNLEDFDLHQWSTVMNQLSEGKNSSYLLPRLRVIDVKLGKLSFLKQNFDQMTVRAKLLPNKDWNFDVEQKNITGSITYHAPSHLLSGYIKRLQLPALSSKKGSSGADSVQYRPSQIPNLNLRVDNLSLGKILVGNLTLKTKSSSDRWLIEYCRIDSPIYQVNLNGEWTQRANKNRTQLNVTMNLKNLAQSLELWNITPAVDAGKGVIMFKGGWNNSIYNFSLASLNGLMYLKLKNGIITHLSPETEEKLGLGKLLSILSLQTIPRRLQLDFSDLSHDGYSFDVFNGNFTIKQGVMNTQDSYLDGPVAYASMKGDLDLVSRIYDVDLSISPHITASLPIVATIAGGPIAGIAAWVANKIITKSMQKITAYTYKISGPWSQPVVQQLTIVKKKIKKK